LFQKKFLNFLQTKMDLADLMQNLKVVNSKEALALLPDTVEVSRIRLRYRYSVYCLEEQTLQLIRNYQRFHYGFRRHVKQLEAEALAQAATLQAQQEEEQKQKRLSTLNLPSLEHLLLPPANSKNNLLSSSSSSTHVVLPPVPQLPLLPRDPIRPLNSLKVGHGGQEFHASVTKLRRMSRRITPPPKAQQVRNNWSAEQLSIGIIGASGMLGRRLLDRLVKHPEDFSLQDLIDEDAGITSTANRSTPQTADTRNGNSLTVPNTAAVSRSTQSLQVEQQKQRLPYQIYAACRVIPDFLEPYRQIPGVRLFDNNEAVMSRCQVVIICCPRHQFKSVMQTIRPQLTREKVILVVGAGWTGNDGWGMRRIQSVFGDGDRALTLSTSLDYVMIDKLTKGLKVCVTK
jgi:hypothetical protein